jgi:integrase/recombinase XerD
MTNVKRAGRATISLYAHDGRRKYLTPAELERFIAAALAHPRPEVATLCLLLAYTGCRISEALALRGWSFDLTERSVAIRTLKKRGVFAVREVPLPDDLISRLTVVHRLDEGDDDTRLWTWSRGRAWTLIKQVMLKAQVASGPHQTAKGLRHGFGVHAVRSDVPLTLVQRWLGHASLATTAIYLDVIGAEERELASRMWRPASPATVHKHRNGRVQQ